MPDFRSRLQRVADRLTGPDGADGAASDQRVDDVLTHLEAGEIPPQLVRVVAEALIRFPIWPAKALVAAAIFAGQIIVSSDEPFPLPSRIRLGQAIIVIGAKSRTGSYLSIG